MTRKTRGLRNMYRVFFLFFIMFKFIGLATFSMNNQTILKKKCSGRTISIIGTKLEIFYNLLLSCLMIGSNYITIPILYESEYEYRSIITTIIEIFLGILGSLVVSFTLLCYCVNQSVLIRIVNYLSQIENVLYRLPQPLNWKHIFYVLLIVYIFKLNLCIAVLVTDYMSFHANPILWLAHFVPATIVGLLFIQYFSVLTLADAIFVNINTFTQNLCRNWSADTRTDTLIQSRRVFITCSSTQFLVQIRNLHDHLCDITNEMSQFYSFPVLIGTSYVFFILLYNTFYLFKPIMVDNVSLDIVILVNTLLWIIFLLYPLGLLTTKITKITKEVRTSNLQREETYDTMTLLRSLCRSKRPVISCTCY